MYLLGILRFILGLVSRITSAANAARSSAWMADSHRGARGGGSRVAVPHDWVCMDYVLSERLDVEYRGRGTLDRTNHPLSALFRLMRRLAALSEPCPALAPLSVERHFARPPRVEPRR